MTIYRMTPQTTISRFGTHLITVVFTLVNDIHGVVITSISDT